MQLKSLDNRFKFVDHFLFEAKKPTKGIHKIIADCSGQENRPFLEQVHKGHNLVGVWINRMTLLKNALFSLVDNKGVEFIALKQ